MDIVSIDPIADPRWDAYLRTHPDAVAFQLSGWAEVLRSAYRFTPRYLAIDDAGTLRGAMPLMDKRGPVSGRRMRSLPVVQVGGPVADDLDGAVALTAAARRRADDAGAALVIDSRVGGLEQLVEGIAAQPRHPTWMLDVPPPDELDAWRASRSSNLRRSIRKAEKAGLTVREAGSAEDVRAFHHLYLMTMRKHRTLPRTLRHFEIAREALSRLDAYALFLVEHDGRPVAGGMYHRLGDTIELVYNASDDAMLDLRPNHALYMHVIEWAAARGLRRMDYGGAWPDSSLAAFKQLWGAVEVPEFRYVRAGSSAPADVGTVVTGRAGRARERIEELWDRVPLPLTAAAGHFAYRWL